VAGRKNPREFESLPLRKVKNDALAASFLLLREKEMRTGKGSGKREFSVRGKQRSAENRGFSEEAQSFVFNLSLSARNQ
jgi:hypothetical protein